MGLLKCGELLQPFEVMRTQRQAWRTQLTEASLLCCEANLLYVPIPTTCGLDRSCAIECLLTTVILSP